MNDPTLGRFVDRRNRRANLFGAALWRRADLFLQSAQVRLNASIMERSVSASVGHVYRLISCWPSAIKNLSSERLLARLL